MVDVVQTVPTVVEVDSIVYEQDVETVSNAIDLVDYGENTVVETVIEVIERGPQGPQGPTGDKASISADTPNAIHQGSDGKMLVNDVLSTNCDIDLSAIYALSK